MSDAGNRLADLLGEETVERLRQSSLWRAIRDLAIDDGVRPMSEDIERGQEELLSYLRASVEEIMRDAKVFPQLGNIISNAAKLARASYHWERHIGRTRHSAQMRRLVMLADTLSQAAALLDGVDLDEEQLVSVADEERFDVESITDTNVEVGERFAHVHRMLSDLQAQIPGIGFVTVQDDLLCDKIEDIKRYIRGENNG